MCTLEREISINKHKDIRSLFHNDTTYYYRSK